MQIPICVNTPVMTGTDEGHVMRINIILKTALRALLIVTITGGVIGTTSCAWVKASGTVAKGVGDGMTKAADQQEEESFFGKLLGLGGKIYTSVGGTVEKAADDGASKTAKKKGNSAGNSKASTAKTTGVNKTGAKSTGNDKPIAVAKAEPESAGQKSQELVVKLKYQSVDVRSSANEGADVVGKVRGGDKLAKTGETGAWIKVRLKDGTTGWLGKMFVEDFSAF